MGPDFPYRLTKSDQFGMATRVERNIFVRKASLTPLLRGLGLPARPSFGEPLYLCPHPLASNDHIRRGNRYLEERMLGVSHAIAYCTNASCGLSVTNRFFNRYLLLSRDAMRKRRLCCRPVSVCPSVCHVGGLYPHGRRYRQTSFSAR